MKSISSKKLPNGLNLKDEVQMGKTKLFIRTPETYFAIEQFRERSFERFAEVIQRSWRRYYSSKELVSLQSLMHAVYSDPQVQKTRRRDSIYCPFSGDSLNQLDVAVISGTAPSTSSTSSSGGKKSKSNASTTSSAESKSAAAAAEEELRERFKESMYRIIDHYNVHETVLFVDPCAAQLLSKDTHPIPGFHHGSVGWCAAARVIVLTTAAVYIMEHLTPAKWLHMQTAAGVSPAEGALKPMPCMLTLRRRIPLQATRNGPAGTASGAGGAGNRGAGDGSGCFTGVMLSKLADCCVLMLVSQPSALLSIKQQQQMSKEFWVDNDSDTKCSVSGTPFSLFTRRHHCRVSGKLVCAASSMHRQLLPDLHLHTPQRISDAVIGLESCDPLEDLLLITSRKTEVNCDL